MKTLEQLKRIVTSGLTQIKKVPHLLEGVVYASSNRRSIARMVYTTHLPCNGLEEPKSDEDFGLCVELWFQKDGKKYYGFGQEPNDLSPSAVNRAIAKAVRDAVSDPDFFGFYHAKPKAGKNTVKKFQVDSHLLRLTLKQEAELLSKLAWETIEGASSTLQQYSHIKRTTPEKLGYILNGDHFLISERMAVANTNGVFEHEESTVVLSFLTAMVEREKAKGSAWSAIQNLNDLNAREMGKRVTKAAIKNIGGSRLDTGQYTVVFGPQAVTELFGSLLLPHLTLGMVDFGASLFQGKFGKQVASPLLSISDDPTLVNGAGSKRVSCEGAPTQHTPLIKDGKLVGLLADSRMRAKFLHKKDEAKKKLGVGIDKYKHAIRAGNGFRFSRGGGRVAASSIGIHATNFMIETSKPKSKQELIKKVDNGVYIGRLWYTYPVGGYASGIISGTVIADSFRILDGKLAEPLLPNTIRIEDNLLNMIGSIEGISPSPEATILWASDEITYAPWVAIKNVHLFSINNPSI